MKAKSLFLLAIAVEAILAVLLLLIGPESSGALRDAAGKVDSCLAGSQLASATASLSEAHRLILLADSGQRSLIVLTVIVLLLCVLMQASALFLNRSSPKKVVSGSEQLSSNS